jgi:hypothetical protein
MTKHIVCYSGGHSSAIVAVEVVRKFGKENVILLNHDIHPDAEGADIKRFKTEVADYLGITITYANHVNWDTKDQFQVVVDARAFKVGNGTALCTNRLKTAPFEKYLKENFSDKNCVIYYGFDANEGVRIQRRIGHLGGMGYKTDYPLALWKDRTIYKTDEISIERPNVYELFKHGNCFTGDTEFLTKQGSVSLVSSVGKEVEVITRNGWANAEVQHFGTQKIVKVVVTNGGRTKVIKTTEGHRWITPKHNHKSFGFLEKTTVQLVAGDKLPISYKVSESEPSRAGVQHGFVFGDGSLYRTSSFGEGRFKGRAYVAVGKEDILPYFDSTPTPNQNINGLPAEWKILPDLSESEEYLMGFIVGLVASDGSVSKSGVSISNKDFDNLQGINKILNKLGIVSWVGNMKVRDTNYKLGATIGQVVIPRICFKSEWLVRSFHKERLGNKFTEPKCWTVQSVEVTEDYEDVYCAVVQGDLKEFTLEGNVLTGNCTGCLKAGKQHWYIVYLHRKEVWERAKMSEDVIGYTIMKNQSLDELEDHFKEMEALGITTTEHENAMTFFARVRKVFKALEADEEDVLPCECTES